MIGKIVKLPLRIGWNEIQAPFFKILGLCQIVWEYPCAINRVELAMLALTRSGFSGPQPKEEKRRFVLTKDNFPFLPIMDNIEYIGTEKEYHLFEVTYSKEEYDEAIHQIPVAGVLSSEGVFL